MVYSLVILASFFLIIIVYLLDKIQTDRVNFKTKIKILEEFMVHINNEQFIQNNKLHLTDELKQKIKLVNDTLNREIFDLSYQLFEELGSKK
jgi:hypothetical protein